jgi:hypothetical protein
MSKLSDTLKKALEKKQGQHHLENDTNLDVKVKTKKPAVPAIAGKPVKKSSGRGR